MRPSGIERIILSLLLVALIPAWGCAPRRPPSEPFVAFVAEPSAGPAGADAPQSAPAVQAAPPVDPRVRALEQELAASDRQIAAVRSQIDGSRPTDSAPGATGSGEKSPASPAASAPAAPQVPAPPQPSAESPVPSAPASALPAIAAPANAAAGWQAAPRQLSGVSDAPAAAAASEARLGEAQKRIAKLEQQLSLEVMRRQEVEAEMSRLLAESSAGPYEKAPNVVEKHLRRELDRSRKEVRELRSTLLSERRERDSLERRYAALEKQAQAAAAAPPANAVPNEEIEALKERQRRVLASIQQDLAASKQREAELQASLEQSQGSDAVSAAAEVTDLRDENSALQMRLDEEHQRNRDLAAKLQTATRVTDLIYKMQSGPVQGVAAVPLPAE